LRPFIYLYERERNTETYEWEYREDRSRPRPLRFFIKGTPYKLWGLFEMDIHLFGIGEKGMFLLGADKMGRDLLSRTLYGTRVSTSIGLIGVFVSFVLGIAIGGISGYYGGVLDNIIQRIIEFIRSIPRIPLWMGLSAALPAHWSALQVYFAITVVLSLAGWTGLARVVRGKFLSLREEDYVIAAQLAGTSEARIIARHLVPGFLSHIIAAMTLAIPAMILGETSLSFLGLGLRSPVISWGVLLKRAQNIYAVGEAPWLLVPGIFVIIAVLAFNFLGDGLRDAADPYSQVGSGG
jgi:peptide/nickel transport system permease protein